MQYTAQKVQEKTVNSIRSKARRPTENGLNASSGVTVKKDVKSLTREDRKEIARRVKMGEDIRF